MYDQYTDAGASGFVASTSQVPENCAFNGICMKSFNLPCIVTEAIKRDIPKMTLNDAETAIRAGFLFTINPVKVSESGPGRTVFCTAGVALKQRF